MSKVRLEEMNNRIDKGLCSHFKRGFCTNNFQCEYQIKNQICRVNGYLPSFTSGAASFALTVAPKGIKF